MRRIGLAAGGPIAAFAALHNFLDIRRTDRICALQHKPVTSWAGPVGGFIAGPAQLVCDNRYRRNQLMTTKTTSKAKPKIADVQEKAKAVFGDLKDFTQGNVEAVVESGKILGEGLKDLGTGYVAEGRSAIATVNADIKELAAVKSPVDFFKLQSKIITRNFGTAIDFNSKNAEAVLKLAKDVAAPLSKRVGVAVEAVRKAA
jgi:hypothetical protein